MLFSWAGVHGRMPCHAGQMQLDLAAAYKQSMDSLEELLLGGEVDEEPPLGDQLGE